MTPDKQRQKLASQTNIAQKIFTFVPIQEAWSAGQIAQAMGRATGSKVDTKTVGGCLRCLIDAGLVKTPCVAVFQRVPVTAAAQIIIKKEKATVTAPTTTSAPASAIDLLAGIAKTLRAVASDIETAALAIEEGQAKNAEEVKKLHQLQALLKGLA